MIEFHEGLKDVADLGLRLVQHESEFLELFKRVHAIQPKTYVQIGSFQGACEIVLSRACAPGATIISVDNGTEGRKGEPRIPAIAKAHEFLQLKGFNMCFVEGDSSKDINIRTVNILLGRMKPDFVYIDGGHKFQQTMDDWNHYPADKLVAIHDINKKCGKNVDTPRAWRLIMDLDERETEEIILHVENGGVGLIYG